MPRQLSRQSRGLKILVSVVRFRLWAPFQNYVAAQLSWLERSVHTRKVISSNLIAATTILRAFSSVGQSARLITGRSGVRVPEGPPSLKQEAEGKMIIIWWVQLSWLERQIVALEVVGSTPTIHPIFWRHSQVVRQRTATPLSSVQIRLSPPV